MANRKKNTKTRKEARKELLSEDDAFIEAASQSIAWVDKNKKLVIVGALGLSSLIALGWGAVAMQDAGAQSSSQELASALELLEATVVGEGEFANPTGTPPTFESEEAQLKATLAALNALEGSAGAGLMARFYGADVQVKLGDKEGAIASLKSLAGDLSVQDNLYFLAVERVANLLEETGAAEDAIKELERLRAPGGGFYRDAAAYQIARIHHAQGRLDEARKIWSDFKLSFPDSALNSDVAERLAALGETAVAEDK